MKRFVLYSFVFVHMCSYSFIFTNVHSCCAYANLSWSFTYLSSVVCLRIDEFHLSHTMYFVSGYRSFRSGVYFLYLHLHEKLVNIMEKLMEIEHFQQQLNHKFQFMKPNMSQMLRSNTFRRTQVYLVLSTHILVRTNTIWSSCRNS